MNHRIRVPEIRVVDPNGEPVGIMKTGDALNRAKQYGVDLVEITPNAKPPVCKIMDYGKYKYDQEKKKKEQKKHQVQTKLKEVKFRVNVGDHDYETKMRNLRKFIEHGDRVKISLMFRGRENAHRELGLQVMQRVIQDTVDITTVDQAPRMQGRFINAVLVPKKKQK
ncbi:translation initiation factor IF-3 [Pontiella sp.]|uniref:translation initiation factor IF-3 n=1 Tax=Pontiella sp. TaxID=2837462 RepID=UPI00356A16DC